MLSHLSAKSVSLSASPFTALSLRPLFISLPSNAYPSFVSHSKFRRKFHFRSSNLYKLSFYPFQSLKPDVACEVSSSSSSSVSMDSPSRDLSSSVDSVTDGLRTQSLEKDGEVRLKLEELNWDHSFVRELPGDSRSDKTPRQVCIFLLVLFLFLFSCAFIGTSCTFILV